jgi:hypothetical protein
LIAHQNFLFLIFTLGSKLNDGAPLGALTLKSGPGPPMTLGNAAAEQGPCEICGHQEYIFPMIFSLADGARDAGNLITIRR